MALCGIQKVRLCKLTDHTPSMFNIDPGHDDLQENLVLQFVRNFHRSMFQLRTTYAR